MLNILAQKTTAGLFYIHRSAESRNEISFQSDREERQGVNILPFFIHTDNVFAAIVLRMQFILLSSVKNKPPPTQKKV